MVPLFDPSSLSISIALGTLPKQSDVDQTVALTMRRLGTKTNNDGGKPSHCSQTCVACETRVRSVLVRGQSSRSATSEERKNK